MVKSTPKMDTLPVFRATTEPTAYQSVGYVRQNAGQKVDDFLRIVVESKRLHAPYGHHKEDVTRFNATPRVIEHKFARAFAEIPTGSIVLVPNGNHGLLVQITSDIKAGIIPGPVIVLNPGTVLGKDRYEREEITTILSCYSGEKLQKALANGNPITAMYGLSREVKVLGRADYNGNDGRAMAGLDSVGLRKHYWAQV